MLKDAEKRKTMQKDVAIDPPFSLVRKKIYLFPTHTHFTPTRLPRNEGVSSKNHHVNRVYPVPPLLASSKDFACSRNDSEKNTSHCLVSLQSTIDHDTLLSLDQRDPLWTVFFTP